MRKLISLGLFALMFSIFSSQVFAGNADEFCGPLKQDKNKSLYGLCVAWHNANEKAKVNIAGKFLVRAGFPVPGSVVGPAKFGCLCWNDFTFKEVCEMGKPTGTGGVSGVSEAVAYVDFSTYIAELFGAGPSDVAEEGNVCEHGFQSLFSQDFVPLTLDREERLDNTDFGTCLAEVELMYTLYLEDCETL